MNGQRFIVSARRQSRVRRGQFVFRILFRIDGPVFDMFIVVGGGHADVVGT